MSYTKIFSSETKKGLEQRLDHALEHGARLIGYAVDTNGEYTCLVQINGSRPELNRIETETPELTDEIIKMEASTLLSILEDSYDSETHTFSDSVYDLYKLTPAECVRQYKLYDQIKCSSIGKGIAFGDIKEHGLKLAAERQGYETKDFWNEYQIKPSELASFFGIPKSPIDYLGLAECLKITSDELLGVMTRDQRYNMRRALAKNKQQ